MHKARPEVVCAGQQTDGTWLITVRRSPSVYDRHVLKTRELFIAKLASIQGERIAAVDA